MVTDEASINARARSALWLFGGIVLWGFAAFTFFFLGHFRAMVVLFCDDGDARFLCSPTGESVIADSGVLTAVVAVALGTAGAILRGVRGQRLWLASMTLLCVAWLAFLALVYVGRA